MVERICAPMKPLILLFIVVCGTLQAGAQTPEYPNAVQLYISALDYPSLNVQNKSSDPIYSYNTAYGLGYGRNFGKLFNIQLPLRVFNHKQLNSINGTRLGKEGIFTTNDWRIGADLLLEAQHWYTGKKWVPYVHTGFGFNYGFKSKVSDLQIPLGIGMRWNFHPNFVAYLQPQMRWSVNGNAHHAAYTAGLIFQFRKGKGPLLVKHDGDRDKDGVKDSKDRCPDSPGPASNEGCPVVTEGVKQTLNYAASNIEFELGLAALKGNSYSILDGIADIMKKYPNYHLSIEGHTDNTGTPATNQTLSVNRAEVCKEYLMVRGIPASRITTKGFGDTRPLTTNDTEEGKARNRRVEFKLYLPEGGG